MVENVQRRFTKRIGGISHLTYPARLQFLGLEALQERRLKFDLIMCHKVMYNFVEVDASDFFCLYSEFLMIEHVVIMSDWSNLVDVWKYCFSSRVVDLWNNLPRQVVNLTSVNSFKSALI